MKVESNINFIKSWNSGFSDSLNLKLVDELFIEGNFNFQSYRMIAPWHPILFSSKLRESFERKEYSNLNKYNNMYCLICIPEKDLYKYSKTNLTKDNLFIHFINIENKTCEELFKKFKYNVRREIKLGLKKFNFLKIKTSYDFEKNKVKIRELIVKQHMIFLSPCPPFELIESLYYKNALDIYIAKYGEEVVAFSSLSKDKNIVQIAWTAKDLNYKKFNLDLAFNYFCLKESIKNKAKILSLGTSSRNSLSKFKEKLNPEKGLLVKSKLFFKNDYTNFQYMKSQRNKINLILMKIFLKFIIFIFGTSGFEFISRQVWKRFD